MGIDSFPKSIFAEWRRKPKLQICTDCATTLMSTNVKSFITPVHKVGQTFSIVHFCRVCHCQCLNVQHRLCCCSAVSLILHLLWHIVYQCCWISCRHLSRIVFFVLRFSFGYLVFSLKLNTVVLSVFCRAAFASPPLSSMFSLAYWR